MKQYNIRLDQQIVKQLDSLNGCRSKHIRDAIQLYLQSYMSNGCDRDVLYIQHLEDEVSYLRSHVNALMISKLPLLQRVIHRLQNK